MPNEKKIAGLLSLLFVLFALGFLFHRSPSFAGGAVGHLVGIIGTAITAMTLVYPFRKRVLERKGKKNPLNPHIYYGLVGPSLVVIHSAHKFASLIGILCFSSMFLVVLSGIVGKFLFRRVSRTLKEQTSDLTMLKALLAARRREVDECKGYLGILGPSVSETENAGPDEDSQMDSERRQLCESILNLAGSIAELEHVVAVFSSTKTLFSRWIGVHYGLTIFFFVMIAVHVLTTLYYGLRWI